MLFNNSLNVAKLDPPKIPALLQRYGVEPKLCEPIIALYVYMRWFVSIT